MYGANTQVQKAIQDADEMAQTLIKYREILNQQIQEAHTQSLKQCEDKLTNNKQQLRNRVSRKPGQNQPQQLEQQPLGQYLESAKDVEQFMSEQMNEVVQGNSKIINELLRAQKSIEQCAQRRSKLNRNTSRELGLMRDIEEIRNKMCILVNIIEEHERKLHFSEPSKDYHDVQRVIDIEEQSVDLLSHLKSDYIRSKIMLDKSQFMISEVSKIMNDVKMQQQK